MASISLEGLTLRLRTKSKDDDKLLNDKLKIIYKKLDFDDKGYVQVNDFVTWAEKATELAGVTLTDKIKETWMAAYDVYFGHSTNFDEWKHHHIHKIMKAESLLKINLPLFESIDVGDKGYISWNEYKAFVMPLGATEAEAHVGFGSIDANGDGVISFEEFSQAYTMYHTDRSDSKYKHFWGEFQSDNSFLIEKLRRFYNKFDFEGNGRVTKNDSMIWLEKTSEIIGAKVTAEAKRAWTAWFDAYFANSKSFDEWKAHWLALSRNTKDLREYAAKMNTPIFKTMDIDGNGTISWKEYKAFVMPLGATEAEAHLGFWAIDINGDGVLSMKEFSNACTKYFTDRTDSKSKHFFGEYKPDDTFLMEKLKRIYKMNDLNNNGVVEKKDYLVWAERAASILGVPLSDKAKNLWMNQFDTYIGEAKNFGEWKDNFMNQTLKIPSQVPSLGVNFCHEKLVLPFFKAVDVNSNNEITWNEYKAFVMPLGVSEADAHVGFGSIDSNGDGGISYEEFALYYALYYMDRYDSKYKHFFGQWKGENGEESK